MKLTTTRTTTKTYTKDQFKGEVSHLGIETRKQLEVSPRTGMGLIVGMPVVAAIFAIAGVALFNIPLIVLAFIVAVWADVTRRLIKSGIAVNTTEVQNRGLNDELDSLHHHSKTLRELKTLIPEGSGMVDKIDEYNHLTCQIYDAVEQLPDAEGRHNNAYRAKDDIRTQMLTLASSGRELADLIATQRTENTVQTISHIGIDLYAENVSLATAAYRALGTGEEPVENGKAPKIVVGETKGTG